MKLHFSIETEDLYGEDGNDFEALLSDSLRREIIKNGVHHIASDKFKEFSKLTSDTIVAQIKLKMENFLSEEIALTEGWGKPTFVGSIEDLIKKRFDDILLRPVDNSGKTLQGCTSSGTTWIEWRIKSMLEKNLEGHIKGAAKDINQSTKKYLDETILELKNKSLKNQVETAFTSILTKAN